MFLRAGNQFVNLAHVSKTTLSDDGSELRLHLGPDGASIVRLTGDDATRAREVLDACVVRVAQDEAETD